MENQHNLETLYIYPTVKLNVILSTDEDWNARYIIVQ